MRCFVVFLCAILPLLGGGRDWPDIPAEVWAIKEGAPGASKGAVIVFEKSRYGVKQSEFDLRIRIFSEPGKAVAQLDPFSTLLRTVEGRVVHADGRATAFNDKKDFAEQTVKVGGFENNRKVVIPPGITTDCVLDLHWEVNGTYLWGTEFERFILRSCPIQKLILELADNAPMASALLGTAAFAPKMTETGGYRVYTFENLPAVESVPYSASGMRDLPSLFCFKQPIELREAASSGPDVYWKTAAEKEYRQAYEQEIQKGKKYRAFADAILKDLPVDPIQKCQELFRKLNLSVLNIHRLTLGELAALPKKVFEESVHPTDLDEAVDRRWTTPRGMLDLTYQLLVDSGIKPKVLRVSDRNTRAFRYKLPCLYQFTTTLLGVDNADRTGTAWFDPGERFFPLGVVEPQYQGTHALMFDSSDWSVKQITLPPQPAGVNRRVMEYDIAVDEGGDSFKVKAAFTGYPEFSERATYLLLEPKEQNKKLKETFEEGSKNLTVSRAEVLHAQDLKLNVGWEVEGARESEGTRRRSLDPFPGMGSPLWIPDSWPTDRKEQIVLPFCRVYQAVAQVRVPKDFKVGADQDFNEENTFGSVSWTCVRGFDADGTLLKVTYEVQAKRMLAAPSDYEALKQFIGWVEKGWRRTLLIEKDH